MRICVFAFSYWKYALRGGDGRPCKSAGQGCGKPRMRNLVQNEPHAGGGNPVLAIDTLGDVQNTEAIFTDILGTSLGKVRGKDYSAIEKTAFGNADEKGFFTGKPYVDELGYAFLFRNYRADIGKWQTADLLGYPDGWNNLAYCNNFSSMAIDYLGAILKYPSSMQSHIDTLNSTPTGKAVLDQLRNSKNTHTITESASGEGSKTSATNDANAMNGKGSGSTITMDTLKSNNSSPDGNGWERPYELGIFHELKHAADMDKGTLDKNKTDGIENCEIDACKETNKVLEELQKIEPDIYNTYEPRKTYGGKQLPE